MLIFARMFGCYKIILNATYHAVMFRPLSTQLSSHKNGHWVLGSTYRCYTSLIFSNRRGGFAKYLDIITFQHEERYEMVSVILLCFFILFHLNDLQLLEWHQCPSLSVNQHSLINLLPIRRDKNTHLIVATKTICHEKTKSS